MTPSDRSGPRVLLPGERPPAGRGAAGLPAASLLALLVLAASLTVTWLVWWSVERAGHRAQGEVFDLRVRELATRIEGRMQDYVEVLRGVKGLFAASVSVSRAEFRLYVAELETGEAYPGIQGIAYAAVVPAADLAQHVRSIREEGFAGYTVWPAGPRETYTAIVYIEPFSGRNLRAFGYDMFSEPVRRAAMERARDEGGPAASSRVRLVQETDGEGQSGFLIYLPVYRNGAPAATVEERRAALVGWVYAPFRVDDLMEGILGRRGDQLAVAVHDGDSATEETRMSGHATAAGETGRFTTSVRLSVAGQRWTLVVRSLPGFEARLDTGKARLVAGTGVALGLLLSLLTASLALGRARAVRAAREIAESEARYRQMFEENVSISYLVDPEDGRIVDANESALGFWGRPRADVLGTHLGEIDTAAPAELRKLLADLGQGSVRRFEARHRLGSGEVRDVEVTCGPLSLGGRTVLYSILHDVTERRRQDEAIRVARVEVEETNEKLREANRELAEMASRDLLTGAWNRRKLLAEVRLEMERASRSGRPLSLFIFDLDHFKEVNDRLGHHAGDRILSGVSALVRERIREVDSLTRWGGEEFLVVTPGASEAEAAILAERLRTAVAEYRPGDCQPVTASFGVAEHRRGESLDDWLGRADAALYEAKRSGRNLVRRAADLEAGAGPA